MKLLKTISVAVIILLVVFAAISLQSKPQRSAIINGVTDTATPTVTLVAELAPTPSPTLLNDDDTVTPKVTVSPTTTPTQLVKQPTTGYKTASLPELEPEIITSNAGSVTDFVYKNLEANTLYKVDLSAYKATAMVVKWPVTAQLQWKYTTDGKLGALQSMPIDDDGIENEPNYYSGLQNIPEGAVFYILSTKPMAELSVQLILPVEEKAVKIESQGIYNSDSGAAYTSLPMVTRDSWGANTGAWDGTSNKNIDDPDRYVWYPVYYTVARIVVHHTATAPNTSNPSAAVRAIYLYHSYSRGWGDIGYNYIIDQNGTIYEGKGGGDETQGYHAFGSANRMSLAISVIGDYSYSAPSAGVRSSLIKLLAEKATFYNFNLRYSNGGQAKWKDLGYTVFGHRDTYRWYDTPTGGYWDIAATACPGNAFEAQLSALTRDAEAYRVANFAQIKTVVNDVNTSFSYPHEQGVLVVKYNVPDSTPVETIRSYIPAFSGITNYTISGNTVTFKFESSIITHPRYGDTEYLIPPMGWLGYYNEYGTFTPEFIINGPENRAKTLMKIFRLDPRVKAADLKHSLTTQLVQ